MYSSSDSSPLASTSAYQAVAVEHNRQTLVAGLNFLYGLPDLPPSQLPGLHGFVAKTCLKDWSSAESISPGTLPSFACAMVASARIAMKVLALACGGTKDKLVVVHKRPPRVSSRSETASGNWRARLGAEPRGVGANPSFALPKSQFSRNWLSDHMKSGQVKKVLQILPVKCNATGEESLGQTPPCDAALRRKSARTPYCREVLLQHVPELLIKVVRCGFPHGSPNPRILCAAAMGRHKDNCPREWHPALRRVIITFYDSILWLSCCTVFRHAATLCLRLPLKTPCAGGGVCSYVRHTSSLWLVVGLKNGAGCRGCVCVEF